MQQRYHMHNKCLGLLIETKHTQELLKFLQHLRKKDVRFKNAQITSVLQALPDAIPLINHGISAIHCADGSVTS